MTIETFEPAGTVERLLASLLRGTLKAWLKPAFSPRWSIPAQRRWLGWMAHLNLPPRGVVISPGTLAGLPGEWLRGRDGSPRRGTVLYLHGGAYVVGSPATHRSITGALARGTGMAVFALDYRLAPEHPLPAALHDALAACRALRGAAALPGADALQRADALRGAGPLVLAGDSAGGGLALATALALRDAGEPLPAALVLMAPWVDLTLAQLPPATPGEAMLSRAWVAAGAAHYLAGADPAQPAASPLHADLRGLPPTLLQVGTDDLLHGEVLRLHGALGTAGVAVRCEVSTGRWHVFQSHAGTLPSADQALARACAFIGEVVDQAAATPPADAAATAAPAATAATAAPATPAAPANLAAPAAATAHTVVILGAGMSGLCMAIQLKKAGIHDFVILEKSAGLGGTWWDNRYPGAHVDVPAPLYSFSFAPNPHWARRFASAPEIQAYMRRLAERHGIVPHIRFSSRLSDARFDQTSGHWQLATAAGQRLKARFFVCSTGPLSQARWPDIPGLDDFKGTRLHSARWDHSAPLAGQRVAVIGTGSTASQLIPPIAEQAAQLHVFQRSANWVLPRLDRRYHALDRLLARLPPYAALVRGFWYRVLEWGRKGFDEGTAARKGMLKTAAMHRQRQVADAALRQRLTPTYPLGCKRLIYSNDYLRCFNRPNTELVTTAITRITAHGIVTADGRERPVDVLVCATGFETVQLLSGTTITGCGGRTLREAWGQGPEAYYGLTVAGFPNLFLMLGPNTATGHTSTLLYIEPGVAYAIACMQRVLGSGGKWLDVKPEVFRAHNDALQKRLQGSVWTTCQSWYRTEGGKVVALWPGFTDEYRLAIQRPNFADYNFAHCAAAVWIESNRPWCRFP